MSGLTNEYLPQDFWYFDFRLTSENTRLRELAGDICNNLNIYTGRLDDVKLDLMVCILANLYQASLKWKCLAISRSPKWYANIPAEERLPIHSYDFVVRILNALVAHGLIEQDLGYHNETGTGHLTKIHPTDALSRQLEFLTNAELDYLLPDVEIELRDVNKQPMEFADTDETLRMREDLRRYNALLQPADISLAGLNSDLRHAHSEYLLRSTYYNNNKARSVRLRPMRVRRIFNEDFEHGGRFYGGIENMPSQLRGHITIDGNETVELDFSAYQLRMLYHKLGINYRRDAYAVAADYTDSLRPVYKIIALAAINADNENECLNGIRYELRNSQLAKLTGGITDARIKPLLDKWVNAHSPIRDYLYSGIGLELQRIDSDIANCILIQCLRKNILVLSVHDSFIIRRDKERLLKRIMRRCYRERFDFNPVIN